MRMERVKVLKKITVSFLYKQKGKYSSGNHKSPFFLYLSGKKALPILLPEELYLIIFYFFCRALPPSCPAFLASSLVHVWAVPF
jgi:hypothetical protein